MAETYEQVRKQGIVQEEILSILTKYDLKQVSDVTIGMIASHSALDLADGATDEGFKTAAICEIGRHKTYSRYKRIITETLLVDKFRDILDEGMQKKLRERNTIVVPNRSLTAYVPVEKIESDLHVPVFGNRYMLKADDRKLQRDLFEDAGLLFPKQIKSYKEIDGLYMVKAMEPEKKIERAFFTCTSPNEFKKKYETIFGKNPDAQTEKIDIWIEEYVIGPQFSFNYFYSPLKDEVEFLGIDTRIQTNIGGLRKLPLDVDEQVKRNLTANAKYIEIGHKSATIRESMLEKVYDIADKFVKSSKRLYAPHGIVGPFALQGAVTEKQEIIVYDLSPRMPGSPVLYSSPYSKYYFGYNVTSGRRVAMEIKEAIETKQLDKIIT